MNEIAGQIKFSLPFLSIVLSKSCIILLFHFWSIIEALVVFEFKEILNFEFCTNIRSLASYRPAFHKHDLPKIHSSTRSKRFTWQMRSYLFNNTFWKKTERQSQNLESIFDQSIKSRWYLLYITFNYINLK